MMRTGWAWGWGGDAGEGAKQVWINEGVIEEVGQPHSARTDMGEREKRKQRTQGAGKQGK